MWDRSGRPKISKSDDNLLFQQQYEHRRSPNRRGLIGVDYVSSGVDHRWRLLWRIALAIAAVLFVRNYVNVLAVIEEEMTIQDEIVNFIVAHPAEDIFDIDLTTEAPGDLSDVTVGIYSFLSHQCLAKAIISIRSKYPNVWIVVLDDSDRPLFEGEPEEDPSLGLRKRPPPLTAWNGIGRFNSTTKEYLGPQERYEPKHLWTHNRVRWYRSKGEGFDMGNGAGRNRLVELTHTKYYLQWDDDWVMTDHSDVLRMKSFLEKHDYDIVAGCYETTDVGFFGRFDSKSEPGVLHQHGFQHNGIIDDGFVNADVVDHTMLAKTDRLMQTPWSERLRADGEHFLLFINLWFEGAKVASTNRFRVKHDRSCRTDRYQRFRMRLSEQWLLYGSVTLTDLSRFGFKNKKDTYLKMDRDAAFADIGGARESNVPQTGEHAVRQ